MPMHTTLSQHNIDVADAPQVKQHAYRVNPINREVMMEEVVYLLEYEVPTPA